MNMKLRQLVWILSASFALAAPGMAAPDAPTPPSGIKWYTDKAHQPVFSPAVAKLGQEGIDLLEKGKYREAIVKFDAALKLDPKAASLYQNRGMCHMALEEFDAALADFNQALALDPEMAPIIYRNRAENYKALGKPDLAVADYTRSLGMQPGDADRADMLLERGGLLVDMGDLDAARKDFEQVKAYKPLSGRAYSELSYIATLQKDYTSCLALASKAIEADPHYPLGWVNRSTCELITRQFAAAKKDLDTVIRDHPKLAEAYMNRTAAHTALKECAGAKQDAEKLAQLGSSFAEAARKMAAQCEPAQPLK